MKQERVVSNIDRSNKSDNNLKILFLTFVFFIMFGYIIYKI